jgi:hypothetical protein
MPKFDLPLRVALLIFGFFTICLASACSVPSGGRVIGGQPVQIGEIPTYPGTNEIAASKSQIIGPLFNAAQQEPAPFIGLGIEVEKAQRTFTSPKETTFADIKSFYADKLQSAGWREDGGMRILTTQMNATNPNLQGAIWVRVDQTLLIVLATDTASGDKELMLSLATN